MGLFDRMKDAKDMMGNAQELQAQAMAQQQAAGMSAMPTSADFAARDRINSQGQELRRLMAEGLAGNATITDARDTGERVAGNAVLDLDLAVTLDGGEPYTTTLNYMIAGADMTPYGAGHSYPVRVDPLDRSKLTFSS